MLSDQINDYYYYYAGIKDDQRLYLGCSEIGKKCDRALWYSFRHAVYSKFDGRMKRLFQLGHDWERFFVRDLEKIGAVVHSDQKEVDFGCHIRGHIDGIVVYSGSEYLAEFKTHSEKSFNYLVSKGVRSAKPQHYVQMQLYMHGLGIDRALYVAANKNTSDLWDDVILYDKKVAEKQIERVRSIVLSMEPPDKLSVDDEVFDCKYCDYQKLCRLRSGHNINCRTCSHSTPLENSTWRCELYDQEIPADRQLGQYPCHVIIPSLVPWKCIRSDKKNLTYIVAGAEKVNGIDGESSTELITLMEV